MTIALTLVQIVVVVLFAPLAAGVVRKVKALLQGRRGAPVLLPYWTILTLMRKEVVLSSSTSWVFRGAPFVVLATSLVSAAVLPLVTRGGAAAPLSHFVVVGSLWMLGAVFLVFGGLDSAGAFGGMGASREMTISAFLEPAVLTSLAAFAVASGSVTVDGMLVAGGRGLVSHPWLLPAVGALGLVALGENARYPVDNPATHLELTMVHEAMVLEYSGPYLAMMELASMLKLTIFALLLANILVPAGLMTVSSSAVGLAIAPFAAAAKLAAGMIVLAFLESSMAKLRFYGLPEYFFGCLFLGLTSLGLGLFAGLL
ncbi:MAG TPA: NADH-quinone oxidoreductase subunit H [Vicinamibacterales bacterium]|jgi:formate hydrogenlyase subunit 4